MSNLHSQLLCFQPQICGRSFLFCLLCFTFKNNDILCSSAVSPSSLFTFWLVWLIFAPLPSLALHRCSNNNEYYNLCRFLSCLFIFALISILMFGLLLFATLQRNLFRAQWIQFYAFNVSYGVLRAETAKKKKWRAFPYE